MEMKRIQKALSVLFCLTIVISFITPSTALAADAEYGYDYIEEFSEGLAAARLDNLWGFINEEGLPVVPFIYREVSAFHEGRAVVRKDRLYGYIDQSGKEVIPMQYTAAGAFHEGLAAVRSDGQYGAIDRDGKVVIPFSYDYMDSFREGFAVVEKDGYFNFVKPDGTLLVRAYRLGYAMPFSSGVAYVQEQSGAQYFINTRGYQVFQSSVDAVGPFNDGYAIAARGSNFIILTTAGLNATGALYESIEEREDGYYRLSSHGYRGFFEKSTKKVLLTSQFELLAPPSEGLLLASKGNRYGYVDNSLKTVLPFEYTYAESFSEGRALILNNEMYGFIDKTGEIVIPCIYEEASAFHEGLSIVRIGKYYGCIDKNGSLVVPAEYGYIEGFHNGISIAKKDGRYVVLKNPLKETVHVTAKPTTASVFVDGKEIFVEAYNISNNNYFKLRDVAFVLKGTTKKFNIQYDANTKRITLIAKENYDVNGTEMNQSGYGQSRPATRSASEIFMGGKRLDVEAYLIGGSTYFKLRDLAALIDFDVNWDGSLRKISIDTGNPYTAE